MGKISWGTLSHLSPYTPESKKGGWGPDVLGPLCQHTLLQECTHTENEQVQAYVEKAGKENYN